MATSSRQTSIFGVNDWKSIYKTYLNKNSKYFTQDEMDKLGTATDDNVKDIISKIDNILY